MRRSRAHPVSAAARPRARAIFAAERPSDPSRHMGLCSLSRCLQRAHELPQRAVHPVAAQPCKEAGVEVDPERRDAPVGVLLAAVEQQLLDLVTQPLALRPQLRGVAAIGELR